MKNIVASNTKNNMLNKFRGHLSKQDRESLHGHRGIVVWFTGLSASGKSTIAHLVEKELYKRDCSTYVLDGDNVRHGLCSDLGFSPEDRSENIRRIGEMAKLFVDAGVILLTAFISPYKKDRDKIRSLFGEDEFLEVYVNCPVDVCAARDQKGIYANAKAGIVEFFTGISAPYEPPETPDLIIQSDKMSVEEAVLRVISLLEKRDTFVLR